MFRTLAAVTAVCFGAALMNAAEEEKFTYDRKITHVRYDPGAMKELGRKEKVEAKVEGDPAKDVEVLWHVRASSFDTAPVAGDLFLDDKGYTWSIVKRVRTSTGDRYLFACKKLKESPVPPRQ